MAFTVTLGHSRTPIHFSCCPLCKSERKCGCFSKPEVIATFDEAVDRGLIKFMRESDEQFVNGFNKVKPRGLFKR